ncbi:hypothetical protein WN66_01038 [Saccharomyces cerevisiae]|nr:hypothetical protein WN66_01038 [Saccharomyces cerevisiae]
MADKLSSTDAMGCWSPTFCFISLISSSTSELPLFVVEVGIAAYSLEDPAAILSILVLNALEVSSFISTVKKFAFCATKNTNNNNSVVMLKILAFLLLEGIIIKLFLY